MKNTGRRIVWGPEITHRRQAWRDLVSARTRGGRPLTGQRLTQLQAELDALPCPHWDVNPVEGWPGAWRCERCEGILTAQLIPGGTR